MPDTFPPDELDALLAALPAEKRALLERHLAATRPGPRTHRTACEVARILAAGLTPEAFVSMALRLADQLEWQGDDVAEAAFAAIDRRDVATVAGAASATARTDRAAARDVAIREAWAALSPTLSARSRASMLRRRHGWTRAMILRAVRAGA